MLYGKKLHAYILARLEARFLFLLNASEVMLSCHDLDRRSKGNKKSKAEVRRNMLKDGKLIHSHKGRKLLWGIPGKHMALPATPRSMERIEERVMEALRAAPDGLTGRGVIRAISADRSATYAMLSILQITGKVEKTQLGRKNAGTLWKIKTCSPDPR